MRRLPGWLRQEIPDQHSLSMMKLLEAEQVNTVCSSARCPNFGSCIRDNELTFLILGDSCTRNCRFCAVDHARSPLPQPDPQESDSICRISERLGLDYVVLTSVTRDDLPDAGAGHFARVVRDLHERRPGCRVEVLVPDFKGDTSAIKTVLEAGPDVFGHNIETVPGLYAHLRPGAQYRRSLDVIRNAKFLRPGVVTKSSLMLGLGETRQEVKACIDNLAQNGCDVLVLGQYLQPSKAQVPVERFIAVQEFEEYEADARAAGFKAVSAGPLVRSSYKAKQIYERLTLNKGRLCTTRS